MKSLGFIMENECVLCDAVNILKYCLYSGVIAGFCRGVNEICNSSGMLSSVEWKFVVEISGQTLGLIFKGQANILCCVKSFRSSDNKVKCQLDVTR